MAIQDLINWLLPSRRQVLHDVGAARRHFGEAAAVMASFPEDEGGAQTTLDRIHSLEHRGDDLVRAVTLALDETFRHADRSRDIHNLANSLDNVLDYLYAAAQAFVAYKVHSFTPAMRELIQICAEAVTVLRMRFRLSASASSSAWLRPPADRRAREAGRRRLSHRDGRPV